MSKRSKWQQQGYCSQSNVDLDDKFVLQVNWHLIGLDLTFRLMILSMTTLMLAIIDFFEMFFSFEWVLDRYPNQWRCDERICVWCHRYASKWKQSNLNVWQSQCPDHQYPGTWGSWFALVDLFYSCLYSLPCLMSGFVPFLVTPTPTAPSRCQEQVLAYWQISMELFGINRATLIICARMVTGEWPSTTIQSLLVSFQFCWILSRRSMGADVLWRYQQASQQSIHERSWHSLLWRSQVR